MALMIMNWVAIVYLYVYMLAWLSDGWIMISWLLFVGIIGNPCFSV